jgi:uncharacterized protein
MANNLSIEVAQLIDSESLRSQLNLKDYVSDKIGLPTLNDILKELAKPGRDPRVAISSFQFDDTIKTIKDLKVGVSVPGIITNVTRFGAFVDIGIKENGLIHISQMTDKYIDDPGKVVQINQQVKVKIIEIDLVRKRIQVSLKQAN